jgi:hypothetical protein
MQAVSLALDLESVERAVDDNDIYPSGPLAKSKLVQHKRVGL